MKYTRRLAIVPDRVRAGHFALKFGGWMYALSFDSPRVGSFEHIDCPLRELCQ